MTQPLPHLAVIGLGANLGDARQTLQEAIPPNQRRTFTVEVPYDWLKESPESIEWTWVDFYR